MTPAPLHKPENCGPIRPISHNRGLRARRYEPYMLSTLDLMNQIGTDRRTTPRIPVERLCKVFHEPTRRYLTGITRDVSAGGALVTVESPRALQVGDAIEILIAWHHRAILSASDQVVATITRSLFEGAKQVVAVRFAESESARHAANMGVAVNRAA